MRQQKLIAWFENGAHEAEKPSVNEITGIAYCAYPTYRSCRQAFLQEPHFSAQSHGHRTSDTCTDDGISETIEIHGIAQSAETRDKPDANKECKHARY